MPDHTVFPGRASPLERALVLALQLLFGVLALLLCASPFLLSIQADEAWNLLPVQALADTGVYAHPSAPPNGMAGGVFVLAEACLFWLGSESFWVLRIFPLTCLLLLVLSVAGWARGAFSTVSALLAPCMLLALPGTLSLGSTAFAVMPATLLLFWGVLAWAEWPGWKGAIVAGVLFGLAAATRANVGLIFPVLLGAVVVRRSGSQELLRAAAACVLGLGIFAGGFAALALLGEDHLALTVSRVELATGVGSDPSVGAVLRKIVMANGFMALPLLLAASVAGSWIGVRAAPMATGVGLLAGFGWLAWLAWILIAPIPHLRYLWPALACFAILLGLGLAALHEWGCERSVARARIAALLVGVACLASGSVVTFRNLAVADMNFLTWEWAEVSTISAETGFRLSRSQRRMAEHLRELPEETIVGVLDFALELELLSGRRLYPLRWFMTEELWQEKVLPRRLLKTTHLGRRGHLDPRGEAWLRDHCKLEARFGPYALCRVVGRFPADPEVLRFDIGPRQALLRPAAPRGDRIGRP